MAFIKADEDKGNSDVLQDSKGIHRQQSREDFTALPVLETALPIGEAFWRKTQTVSLQEAEGRICAEYIYLYPPGIPLVTPGEILTGQAAAKIQEWRCAGLEVSGVSDGRIRVIK